MFTKKFEYAFMLIKEFGKNQDKILLGKNIIENLNIPKSMAASILTILSNKGFISGKKGKEGGYCLIKDNITLYDLFVAIEGDELKIFYHDDDYRKIMFEISNDVIKSLKNIKILEK